MAYGWEPYPWPRWGQMEAVGMKSRHRPVEKIAAHSPTLHVVFIRPTATKTKSRRLYAERDLVAIPQGWCLLFRHRGAVVEQLRLLHQTDELLAVALGILADRGLRDVDDLVVAGRATKL
jgi:hypothetical protein